MSVKLTKKEIDEASFDPDEGLEPREDFKRELMRRQKLPHTYTSLSEVLKKYGILVHKNERPS